MAGDGLPDERLVQETRNDFLVNYLLGTEKRVVAARSNTVAKHHAKQRSCHVSFSRSSNPDASSSNQSCSATRFLASLIMHRLSYYFALISVVEMAVPIMAVLGQLRVRPTSMHP